MKPALWLLLGRTMRRTSRYGAAVLAGVKVVAAGLLTVHSTSTSSWSRPAPFTPGTNVGVLLVSDWLCIV